MIKVQSLEQYKESVAQAKKKGYKLTNCYFLSSAIKQKISEGTLYIQSIKNGFLLLDDNEGFYRCYYYLSPTEEPERLDLDKPAVIEFPFNDMPNESQCLQIEKIGALGFRLGRNSGMMSALSESLRIPKTYSEQSIPVSATYDDAEQVFDLLNLSFNPLYAFLPTFEELKAMIEAERILVIRDGQNVAAVLISSIDKKIATIEQVAVDPAYRGKKLGNTIVHAYHKKYQKDGVVFQHWVDINNLPAVAMYEGFGYTFSLRKANEYILI